MNGNKRSGAGALFFNEHNEILIVKPSYKEGWLFPGGIIESNETPSEACEREVLEELGLQLSVAELLCVDYGKYDQETVNYIFLGGLLTQEEIKKIVLQASELLEYRFVPPSMAESLLRPKGAKRLSACLEAVATKTIIYLENGVNLKNKVV